MGFLSKNKDKKQENNLPAPPSMSSAPAPVAPTNSTLSAPPAPASEQVNTTGTLATPPIPGGNLNDIKEAVSGTETPSTQTLDTPPATIQTSETSETNIEEIKNETKDEEEESLFDFSTLNFPEEEKSEENTEEEIQDEKISKTTTDEEINYIKNQKLSYQSKHKEEPYFLTTEEFKSMIEIIDEVKSKVKDSSEKHLRLMDIKSEEETEYENLRKDFQFIENKLYEIDSIIFDK